MTLKSEDKQKIIDEHPWCVYCKCDKRHKLNVDHIIPKAKGGTDKKSNLQVTCYKCNNTKKDLDEKEFEAIKHTIHYNKNNPKNRSKIKNGRRK